MNLPTPNASGSARAPELDTLRELLRRQEYAAALTAAERLMGLILSAVAVEMLLQGIRTFVLSLR